jgi:4'-phosphopantetheinyl transferase
LRDYRALLTQDERQKCDRFRFEKDQHSCLVTRALVRSVLSKYADVAPEAWRFITNEYGRPEIEQPADARWLKFNLSHTNGLIAMIVASDQEVGVDVEDRDRTGRLLDVAERYFSPSEVDALHALPQEEQLERFFLYWTLKESYIKARGMGLAIPLSQFSFGVDREVTIAFDPKLKDDADTWQFTVMSVGRRHAMAASIHRGKRDDLRFVLRETVPLVGDDDHE